MGDDTTRGTHQVVHKGHPARAEPGDGAGAPQGSVPLTRYALSATGAWLDEHHSGQHPLTSTPYDSNPTAEDARPH